MNATLDELNKVKNHRARLPRRKWQTMNYLRLQANAHLSALIALDAYDYDVI